MFFLLGHVCPLWAFDVFVDSLVQSLITLSWIIVKGFFLVWTASIASERGEASVAPEHGEVVWHYVILRHRTVTAGISQCF
jgi:hypothetical protein